MSLDNQLLQRLSGIPGFNKSLITSGGATSLVDSLPASLSGMVLIAYNEALRKVFQIGLVLACLAVLGMAAMEWRNILTAEAKADAKKSERAEEKEVEQTA